MNISQELERRIKSVTNNPRVKSLMKEVDKAAKELKKLEFTKTIESTATKRLNDIDSKYKGIKSQINKIQKQVDLEMSRAYSTLKTAQREATKSLVTITKAVETESQRLKKAVKSASVSSPKKTSKKKESVAKKVTKKKVAKKKVAKKKVSKKKK